MTQVRFGKEATVWYEKEQQGLGNRFIAAVENAIKLLEEPNPPLTPVGDNAGKQGAQKLILHKFPFSMIVYEIDQMMVVVALAHQSRKPGYWRSRVAT